MSVENPMVLDRPERIPHPFDRPIEWTPTVWCGCGCGQPAEIGYEYDGEMYATQGCVIRMMINEGWLKEVG